MARRCPLNINPDALCDNCPTMHWITDKEHLYSQVDHLPIVLEYDITHERIVRGTKACFRHPLYYLKPTQHGIPSAL